MIKNAFDESIFGSEDIKILRDIEQYYSNGNALVFPCNCNNKSKHITDLHNFNFYQSRFKAFVTQPLKITIAR